MLVVTAEENEGRKIVEFSEAPLLLLDGMINEKLRGNSDLETVFKIKKAKSAGIIMSSDGTVIDTNIASEEQLAKERADAEMNSTNSEIVTEGINFPYTRPSTIKVYRSATSKIETVDFYEYCKNVLPNEWTSSWGNESLKAGAMCVKMVGWFRVESPKYPGKGYDVKDTDADQVYVPNSAKTSCTNAINSIGTMGIQSASYLFFPRYLAGREGYYEVGGWDGGTVSQWGTKKFADNGYDYLYMLHYYYDYTARLDGNIMYTFTY